MVMKLFVAAVLLAGLALPTGLASSASAPDLRPSFVVDPPSALTPGAEFTAALAVTNTGSASARSSTTTTFALSRNATLDRGDTVLGTRRFPRMRAGRETILGLRVTVPAQLEPGEYFLVGCVDSGTRVRERSERNNCFSGATLLTVSPSQQPLDSSDRSRVG